MKIVIANSVGINEKGERYIHFPSRWTTIESPSWYDHSKGWMTFYPFNLAYLSSLLKRDTDDEIKFLDGHLNNWNHERYLGEIRKESPDYLVMEISTLSLNDDMRLANDVKTKTGAKLIITGQHPSCNPEEMLNMGADFVCQGEYEYTVLDIIRGKEKNKIKGLYPNERRSLIDVNELPWPEDDDVHRIDYIEPCVSEYREVELFASRGCPLTCTFCVASNVYYGGKPSWRKRKVASIIDEIKYLRDKYPEMEGIFFDDEAHNGSKLFIKELTNSIIDAGLNTLKYNAMCGYWTLDEELLTDMKKAGYYKLRIGIETANQDIAKGINKKTVDIPRLYRVLESAKKVGMKMYGTFTFGAIGSSKEKDLETTDLIKDLLEKNLLHDLQLSICTPQPNTPFYDYLNKKGYLKTKDWNFYDGGNHVVFSYPHYSDKQIREVIDFTNSQVNLYRGPVRFKDNNFNDFIDEMKKIKVKNVFMIRSGPIWLMKTILKIIYDSIDGVKINVAAQPGVESMLKEIPGVSSIYTYNEGFFKKDKFDEKLFDWIKSIKPDAAILLYNHNCDDRKDYEDVEYLSSISNATIQIGVDISGNMIRL